MPRIKLATKLTLLIGFLATLITVLACLAIGLIIFTLTEKQVKTQLIDQSFQVVNDYLEIQSDKLSLKNREDGQTLVMALRNFELSVYIVNVNNQEIGSYGIYRNLNQSEKLALLPQDIIAKVQNSHTGFYRDASLSLHGRYDTFTLPLLNHSDNIGYLQVARQNIVLPMISNAIITAIIILIPIVWLTAIGTGAWGASLILKPLRLLVQYFQNLDINKLPKQMLLPEKIDPEIKTLGETFNILIQRINSVLTRQKEISENISHEFKTPLARISSSLEVLEGQVSPHLQSKIKSISLEAIELGRQVDTLLDLALYDINRSRKEKPYSLAPLVRQLTQRLPQDLSVEVKIPPSLKITVPSGHMQVILQNLITNAARYNVSHGKIFIRANNNHPGWNLMIENTIPLEKNYPRHGHGLGLSIVKNICSQQGLQISFKSTDKKRIRVIITYEKY